MANFVKRDSAVTPSRTRVRASLTTALVLGFGTLIFVGMAVVQGISMWSAQKNTRTLLARNADLAFCLWCAKRDGDWHRSRI